jgi:hypothetical protein
MESKPVNFARRVLFDEIRRFLPALDALEVRRIVDPQETSCPISLVATTKTHRRSKREGLGQATNFSIWRIFERSRATPLDGRHTSRAAPRLVCLSPTLEEVVTEIERVLPPDATYGQARRFFAEKFLQNMLALNRAKLVY